VHLDLRIVGRGGSAEDQDIVTLAEDEEIGDPIPQRLRAKR
jgi:hypothetical protein